MLDNHWDDKLEAAAEEVLETMFFVGVCGPAAPDAYGGDPRVRASLCFEGTPNGTLTLSVSASAARSLAANFLAADDDNELPAAELGNVVCELANMICGALLSRVESEQHFRLLSPTLLEDSSGMPPGQPNRSLDMGDGVMDVWLGLERCAG